MQDAVDRETLTTYNFGVEGWKDGMLNVDNNKEELIATTATNIKHYRQKGFANRTAKVTK